MVRVATYFTSSMLAMVLMVYYAYHTQRQFYPTVQYLVSSKISFVILGNMILATFWMAATLFKRIYFGTLRDVEVELIVEKAKYTIMETALALTIFRNELSPPIIMMFIGLIVVKLLHKLSKCRLEYLEQIMPVAVSTQLRVILLLITLIIMDLYAAYLAVTSVMTRGKSVLILFGFEFGLLLIYGLNLMFRFIIQTIDSYTANGLQMRGLYIMVVDLFCEIIKIITYVSFFSLVFVYYGIPLHIMRDVYAAYISFQRKLLNFIKYLKLTRNLENRFPAATEEELAATGNCLVCREEMDKGRKLPCGHIFHLNCLRTWLQHQQSCPLCRADIPVQNVPDTAANPPAGGGDVNAEGQMQSGSGEEDASGSRSETSPAALESLATLLRKRTNPSTDGVQYPSFFLVVSESPVAVHRFPLVESDVLRELNKGTVVFAFSRGTFSDGLQWLQVPDGWVVVSTSEEKGEQILIPLTEEEDKDADSASKPTSPVLSSKEPVASEPEGKGPPASASSSSSSSSSSSEITMSEVVKSPSAKVYNREHFLNRLSGKEQPSPSLAVPAALQEDVPLTIQSIVEDVAGFQSDKKASQTESVMERLTRSRYSELDASKSRLQAMLKLQVSMEEATKNLVELGQTLLHCQQSWSEILRDELMAIDKIQEAASNSESIKKEE